MGVPDSTVVILYAGAIGATQDLDTLVDALSSLPVKSADTVECWVLGSGVGESSLRDLVRDMPTTAPRVRLLGRRPMDEMPAWTAASDICYVGLRPDDHARFTLPSKVQTAMAMGKPLLASVPGDVDQLVRQHRVGFSSAGEGRAALATQITAVASSGREGLAALGRHARRVYLEQFSLTARVDHLENLMAAAAGAVPEMAHPGAQGLVVQPALRSDLPAIVDVHMRSFPGFFLTFLGPSVPALVLREPTDPPRRSAAGGSPSTASWSASSGGVLDEARFFSFLKQDKAIPFARAALGRHHPRSKDRGASLEGSQARRPDYEDETPATLLSIAVDPLLGRRGLGRLLLDGFALTLADAGISSYKLTTDATDNAAAISFYEKSGLLRAREFVTPEGRKMLEFTHHWEATEAKAGQE